MQKQNKTIATTWDGALGNYDVVTLVQHKNNCNCNTSCQFGFDNEITNGDPSLNLKVKFWQPKDTPQAFAIRG